MHGLQIVHGCDGAMEWRVATHRVQASLRPELFRLEAYEERARKLVQAVERTEMPAAKAVIILELGPLLEIEGPETSADREGGFVAGLGEHSTRTVHRGFQRGIQLDLRPSALGRLLGREPVEFGGRVLGLREVLGPADRASFDRLRRVIGSDEASSLAAVEAWVGRRLQDAPEADPRLLRVEDALLRSSGRASLRKLRLQTGLSERQFITSFVRTVGMTPKRFARLARFEALCARLRAHDPAPWAELALELGYYDQSHLAREVRAFARRTPTTLRRDLGASSTASLVFGS